MSIGYLNYLWYSDYNDPTASDYTAGWKMLMFFPFFNFNKILRDIMIYTSDKTVPSINRLECKIIPGNPFNWTLLDKVGVYQYENIHI
jgi:hypothetical protein